MYTKFYGLSRLPFENTPNPLFLYLSPQHREVLSSLVFGIDSAKGFILVAGDVGTGKTTLVRALLKQINPSYLIINIINPRTNFDDLFRTLGAKFELDLEGMGRLEQIELLTERLKAFNGEGNRVVLLIDEAHLLCDTALEDIRLLSNIESSTTKLLQIVLVGQNEIIPLLEKDVHRALRQRIVISRQLLPLSKMETENFIEHRLKIAGRYYPLFHKRALALIWKESGGVPRLINQICDNALLIGYAVESRTIDKKIILEVLRDMRPQAEHGKPPRRPLPLQPLLPIRRLAPAGVLLLLGVAVAYATLSGKSDELNTTPVVVSGQQLPVQGEALQQPASLPPVQPAARPEPRQAPVVTATGGELSRPAASGERGLATLDAAPFSGSETATTPAPPAALPVPAASVEEQPVVIAEAELRVETEKVRLQRDELPLLANAQTGSADGHSRFDGEKQHLVEANQWLSALASKEYGACTDTVLDLIQMSNSSIEDINTIYHGRKIRLPEITREAMIVRGSGGLFHIHFASFYHLSPAKKVTARLLRSGREAFMVPSLQGKNQIYRVYIGMYPNRAEAERALAGVDFEFVPFLAVKKRNG